VKRALLVLLLAVGCAGADGRETPDLPDVKPGDNALIKAAWAAWGMRGFDRPTVRYVDGAGLNCDTSEGRGFLMVQNAAGAFFVPPGTDGGRCWLGFGVPEASAIWVAGDGAGAGVTKRAIVHELCHFAHRDDNHTGPCNPAPGGQIDQIAARL
jgi:hypothetical protein